MTHKITKVAEYAVIVKENKFLMLKFSKKTNAGERWIFPGGRMEENDFPKEALVREVKEETNLEVEITSSIITCFFKNSLWIEYYLYVFIE